MTSIKSDINIDIKEDSLLKKDNILNILLKDNTTGINIIWATDSYVKNGDNFLPNLEIKTELITGSYGKIIQPRAVKSVQEQTIRKRDRAEVFTPLSIVKQMNRTCDPKRVTKYNWKEYVRLLKLEITCGEAPFIVSRYDPVSDNRIIIPIARRVGFLDRKLAIVSKYCNNHDEWLHWSKIAFQSSYGYEWQGDNLLIARENLLYTFIDYYIEKFNDTPSLILQKEIAEIIAWNIFQMDGLKCVIPMSCKKEIEQIKGKETLFYKEEDSVVEIECEGCRKKTHDNHNGTYVNIMDWKEGVITRFVDMINK